MKKGFEAIKEIFAGFSKKRESPNVSTCVDDVLKEDFFDRFKKDIFYHTEEKKEFAFERLSVHHRKFLEIGDMDKTNLLSFSNDVIAIYDDKNKIDHLIILKELENPKTPKSEENNYHFYKKYRKVKEIPYHEIFNESDLFLRKGESREKMMKVFEKVMRDPGLYHKFRKEAIAPQDPRSVPFRDIFYMVNLMVSFDEFRFKKIKMFYAKLSSQEEQFSMIKIFSIVLDAPEETVDLIFDALGKYTFTNKKNFENNLLSKFRGIFDLVDERNG